MIRPKTVFQNPKALGQLLRRGRKSCGLTVLEATREVGTSKSQLCRIEAGQISDPTPELIRVMVKCADAYGLNRRVVLGQLDAKRITVSLPSPAAGPFRSERLTAFEAKELRRHLMILRGGHPR